MKRLLVILALLLPVTSMTCAPSTAMAAPPRAPLFAHGQAPHRPMEVLGEMVVELGSTSGRAAAMESMREQAMKLGADAVLDVVVTTIEKDVPANQLAGLPLTVMGTLLGLATGDPSMLKNALDTTRAQVFKRPVTVVKGTAVKYVR